MPQGFDHKSRGISHISKLFPLSLAFLDQNEIPPSLEVYLKRPCYGHLIESHLGQWSIRLSEYIPAKHESESITYFLSMVWLQNRISSSVLDRPNWGGFFVNSFAPRMLRTFSFLFLERSHNSAVPLDRSMQSASKFGRSPSAEKSLIFVQSSK